MADKNSTRSRIAEAIMQQWWAPPPRREGQGVGSYLMDFMQTPTMRRQLTPEAAQSEAQRIAQAQAQERAALAQRAQFQEDLPALAAREAEIARMQQEQQALFAQQPPPIGR